MAEIKNPSKLYDRQLQCEFTLISGVFKQGFNTKSVKNNTVNAIVQKSMTTNFTNSANITVYGMNKSDIGALTTLGYAPLKFQANKVKLYAQYSIDKPKLCFSGFIVRSWADFSDPSRPTHFECHETYQDSLDSVDAINVNGSSSVPDIFNNIAGKLGLSLQNNGVTGIINNLILTGSNIDQLKQLSKQCDVNCVVDNGKLKIAPNTSSLSNEIASINRDSGLLSYPTIDAYGVKFRIRYNPVVQLGQYIKLDTSIPLPKQAKSGKWFVYDMQSSLNNRHENWYTDLKCSYNNLDFA